MNPSKPTSSGMGLKSKKQFKFRGKCVPQVPINLNYATTDVIPNDKGSPSKEYAGIGDDSIRIYVEQTSHAFFSKDISNMISNDINYKLRYILHTSLLKAKLLGREVISSEDIEETFSNLKIDKVYGAPSSPNWVPFEKNNLYYLDDEEIDLIEIAETEESFAQEGDIFLDHEWLPDGTDLEDKIEEYTETFTEYFQTMCEAIVSPELEIRYSALSDISENSSIGPITHWFYHFCYFLLMKDITCDSLTIHALQLLEVLENSPLSSLNICSKQLKLLVRLLLQRLLDSVPAEETLKPMCYTLSLLCLRKPLRQMVISKIKEKLATIHPEKKVFLLNIIYFLGVQAVEQIFLPYVDFFLSSPHLNFSDLKEILLAIYGIVCKAGHNIDQVDMAFYDIFGDSIVSYWVPKISNSAPKARNPINFINMKKQLLKTRRKICYSPKRSKIFNLEDVFEIPQGNCRLGRSLEQYRSNIFVSSKSCRKQVIIGKNSLLLSVLQNNKPCFNCRDHSLLVYNL